MKTRILYTDFFDDDYILSLSIKEKYTFSFLLWNKNVNLCGIYKISDTIIKVCCGISQSELDTIKTKFIKDGKFYFLKDWVRIMNYQNYNFFKGEKNIIASNRERALIPEEVIGYRYSIDRVSQTPDTPSNHKSVISNNKPVIRNNNIDSITEEDIQNIVIEYQVTKAFVLSKIDDIKNYCQSKGKYYKDYLATLRNWVKKDAIEIRKEAHGKPRITFINPT